MIQEDKELLLKDLCARLPYHPKGHVVNACSGAECDEWLTCATFPMFASVTNNCRLYLRPMSSMTEEERSYYEDRWFEGYHAKHGDDMVSEPEIPSYIDWLNAHHFDYRGLIEKGLAIEITEENNPYKE